MQTPVANGHEPDCRPAYRASRRLGHLINPFVGQEAVGQHRTLEQGHDLVAAALPVGQHVHAADEAQPAVDHDDLLMLLVKEDHVGELRDREPGPELTSAQARRLAETLLRASKDAEGRGEREMLGIRAAQGLAWGNKVDKGFNTTDIPLEFCLLQGEFGRGVRRLASGCP